jgi:ACT domain-containing protein
MTKAIIITVVGKDNCGHHRQSMHLPRRQSQVNILDITQTIVDGYFNMMMIVDRDGGTQKTFEHHEQRAFRGSARAIGVQVKIQLEEIFNQMHRV